MSIHVQTPHGVGILTHAKSGQSWNAHMAPHVIVRGRAAIPYNADTMPIVDVAQAPAERSDDDIDAWMREHSTLASRKAHEKRVKAYRKAAMTPSNLRADKLIGEHIVIHGEHLVVAAKLVGGYYAVENHTRGYVSSERATWIRGAIKTRDAVRAMDVAA